MNQHRSLGRTSEVSDTEQLSIFYEAEVEATSETEPTIEEITYRRSKKQGKRESS